VYVCTPGYPAWKAHVLYCFVWPVRLYHNCPHYLINGTFFGKKKLLNIKWVFWCSLQLSCESYLVLRRIERDTIRVCADKSLARTGRKQTTATNLRIYWIYSPRSSVHFLSRYSNFCKALKKIQNIVRPTRSPRQQWPPRRTKNGDLTIVF